MISARFSNFLEVIVSIPSLRRFASSTAINKLDVIMPAIEDFPARHIGELKWKAIRSKHVSPGPRKHDVRYMLKQVTLH